MTIPASDKEKFGFFPDNPDDPEVVTIQIPLQWVFDNKFEGAAMMIGMMELYKSQLDMALQFKQAHAQKNGILVPGPRAFKPEVACWIGFTFKAE